MGERIISFRLLIPHAALYAGKWMAILSDQIEGLRTELGGGRFQLSMMKR